MIWIYVVAWYLLGAICSIPVVYEALSVRRDTMIDDLVQAEKEREKKGVTFTWTQAPVNPQMEKWYDEMYVDLVELEKIVKDPRFYPAQIVERDGVKTGYAGIYRGRRVVLSEPDRLAYEREELTDPISQAMESQNSG